MPMINCPECGKQISDLASSCPNCGFPMGFQSARKDTFSENNTQYQNNNTYQTQQRGQPIRAYVHVPIKNSGLGVAALLFSILKYTFIIGAILAIVDLCKKDGKKKICSIVALVICGLWLIIGLAGLLNTDSKKNEADNNVEQEVSTQDILEESGSNDLAEEIEKDEQANNMTDYQKEDGAEESVTVTDEKEPNISKEDFILSCEEVPYKTLARNPEDNIGRHIKLTVKVSQIVQGGLFDDGEYYRVYTNDEYDMWMEDEYFMYDCREEKDMKILQDDILTVYAEFDGTTTVKRALTGTKEDVISIKAIYIDLIEDEDYSSYTTNESNDSETDGLSAGQRNALNQAKSYLSWSAFSYEGLIGQLEYEQYSHEDAVFAADNCGADWNEQAVKKAKSYLEFSSFSKNGLIEQLEFEGFTHEQAVYGAEQNGY